MPKIRLRTAILVAAVGFELLREWYALRMLGFDTGRFVAWVKGEDDGR